MEVRKTHSTFKQLVRVPSILICPLCQSILIRGKKCRKSVQRDSVGYRSSDLAQSRSAPARKNKAKSRECALAQSDRLMSHQKAARLAQYEMAGWASHPPAHPVLLQSRSVEREDRAFLARNRPIQLVSSIMCSDRRLF